MKATHYIDKDTPEIEDFQKCELVHFFRAQYQIYIWDMNLVITVPADVLAPNGARPSAGTVLTGDFNFFTDSVKNSEYLFADHRTLFNEISQGIMAQS